MSVMSTFHPIYFFLQSIVIQYCEIIRMQWTLNFGFIFTNSYFKLFILFRVCKFLSEENHDKFSTININYFTAINIVLSEK